MPSRHVVSGQKIAPQKLVRAKQLRKEMTPGESLLWNVLRRDQLGAHFRRQQIIHGFIVDFYCPAAALVIEVDGAVHQNQDQRESDALRDGQLRSLGLRVARFNNRRISGELAAVIREIRQLIRSNS